MPQVRTVSILLTDNNLRKLSSRVEFPMICSYGKLRCRVPIRDFPFIAKPSRSGNVKFYHVGCALILGVITKEDALLAVRNLHGK